MAPAVVSCPEGWLVPRDSPDAFAALIVHCGAAAEQPGQRGLAHLVEHALFATFAGKAPNQAAVTNAYTTVDRVVFFCHGLRLEAMLRYLQHVHARLEGPAERVLADMAAEVPAVLIEARQRRGTSRCHRLMWEGHPLGRRVLGERPLAKTLPAAMSAGGAAFWAAFAAAPRQVVCVGPQALCGAVRRFARPAGRYAPPPPPPTGRAEHLEPDGSKIQLRLLWRCEVPEADFAFAVASRVLRQRLNSSLRFGSSRVYTVSTDAYPAGVPGYHVLAVSTECQPGDVPGVTRAMVEASGAAGRVSPEEYSEATRRAEYSRLLRSRDAKDVGDLLCTAARPDKPPGTDSVLDLSEALRWHPCADAHAYGQVWARHCRLVRQATTVETSG